MLFLAFFIMAVLHFGNFVVLPLWLVFAPLGVWLSFVAILGGVAMWASK
jgi:hypothetical protein